VEGGVAGFAFGNIMLPMGPNASLKNINLSTNPKPKLCVSKVFNDKDLNAVEGMEYLYKKEIDVNTLSKLLSMGIFGLGRNRRLVPTRWSITAVDDSLGKFLIEQIKDFKEIDSYYLFFGGYFGNYYLVMFFPSLWGYELSWEMARPWPLRSPGGTDPMSSIPHLLHDRPCHKSFHRQPP